VKVTWVLREPKFFTGGEDDADLIKLTYGQLFSRTGVELIKVGQRALELRYRLRFLRAGIKDWLPKERLDIYSVQVRLHNTRPPSRLKQRPCSLAPISWCGRELLHKVSHAFR
jgi:hypothetical protein